MSYIYELFEAPHPKSEWISEYDFNEHPSAFTGADWVESVKDRDSVIASFGAWLEKYQLGLLKDEMFLIDRQAAERHFEGRFAAFQQAVTALQLLTETQFIHEHDQVQGMIDQVGRAFTQQYGDYVLQEGEAPMPLEEFLRKAQPGQRYYFGAVLSYE